MSSQNSEEDLRGGSRTGVPCRLTRRRVFSWVAEDARGHKSEINARLAARMLIHKANVFVCSPLFLSIRVPRVYACNKN